VSCMARLAPVCSLTLSRTQPEASEPTSSLLSRLTFIFLLPLLVRGRKTAFTLDSIQLFGLPPLLRGAIAGHALSATTSSSYAHPAIFVTGASLMSNYFPRRKQSLLYETLRAFFPALFAPVVPKLLLIAATFAQTYLVQSMINFVSSYSDNSAEQEPVSYGWALVASYVLVYLSISAMTALYWEKVCALMYVWLNR
jgi:ATP-binding cassette subfamily C (CFTR/MRP) protein 1